MGGSQGPALDFSRLATGGVTKPPPRTGIIFRSLPLPLPFPLLVPRLLPPPYSLYQNLIYYTDFIRLYIVIDLLIKLINNDTINININININLKIKIKIKTKNKDSSYRNKM